MVGTYINFLIVLSETMAQQTKVQKMIRKAKEGDERALTYLEVEDKYLRDQRPLIMSYENLRADYYNLACFYFASKSLGLISLPFTSKMALKYMKMVAAKYFKKDFTLQDMDIKREDILEKMEQIINDKVPEMLALTNDQVRINEEDGDDTDIIVELPPINTKEKPKPNTPSRKRKATSELEGSATTTKKRKGPDKKRYHHKRTKCRIPNCNFSGWELKLHLQVHVRRGDISQEHLEPLLSIFKHGKNQRGPKSRTTNRKTASAQRKKRWCPVEGCYTISNYIDKHLQSSAHNMSKTSVGC